MLRRLMSMILLVLILLPITHVFAERQDQVTNRPLLLVHYMPWYQTPDVSGYWGWHWTMNHFDPSQQLASHFTPLTGPYDSTDEALLEYQVLLMKLSGIDGVIVDWYGMEDFRDYTVLNESTSRLFDIVKRAGLRFVICYEDQSIKHRVDEGDISADEAIAHGQDVMRYMDAQWFNDDAYVKVNGQPLLFVFGPQYFRSSTQWEDLFSVLDTPPALITLDQHMVSGQLSSYPWPPMLGVNINQDFLVDYLADFYRKAGRWDYVVGGAFPGFYDIYEEAGVRASYGFLDAQLGETFRLTLQTALDQQPDMIQLITWNDYGEGTLIEPTEEFGYQYLEILQEIRRTLGDFSYTADDLRLPLRLYQARQAHTEDETQLDEAFDSILAGDLETAETIIASFE